MPRSTSLYEFTTTKDRVWELAQDLQATEYGFYSNVEPHKPHPRWSQQWEKDIGTGETRDSLLYNGYGDLVGSMYTGKEA